MSSNRYNATDEPKWRYEHTKEAQKRHISPKAACLAIITHSMFYVFSVLCALATLIATYWLCKQVFAHTLMGENWMQPSILLVSTFFAGVLIRLGTEQCIKGMSVFLIVICGLATYAGICWLDIQQTGSLFSTRFLPETLHLSMTPYVFASPIVGIAGMLCFRWFTLK